MFRSHHVFQDGECVYLLCLWFIFLYFNGVSFCFYFSQFFHSITGRWVCVTSLMSCCRLFFCLLLHLRHPPWNYYCEGFIPWLVCVCLVCFDAHVNTNRRMSIKIVPCLFCRKNDQRSINIMCPTLIYTYSTKKLFVFFSLSLHFFHFWSSFRLFV